MLIKILDTNEIKEVNNCVEVFAIASKYNNWEYIQ